MFPRFLAIAGLLASFLAVVAIVREAGEPRAPAATGGGDARAAAPRARARPTPSPRGARRRSTPTPRGARRRSTPTPRGARRRPTPSPRRRAAPRVAWRDSRALGTPTAGRLVRGVNLPASGPHHVTWDPVRKRSPNRWWRRYGTDDLVRVLLDAAKSHTRSGAPRLVIGDLSCPHGGDFGRRFGPLGHISHQNGLDADVYFPRKDGKARAPRRVAQVDRRAAQALVDRFVEAGARRIFVGAALKLRGPSGIVQVWPNHDDHLHVRLGPRR